MKQTCVLRINARAMLNNYFRSTLRYLLKHKNYTVINLLGLTLGFACFLLLHFYVRSEKNVDRQHGNVYRLLQQITDENGRSRETAIHPPRPGLAAKEQFPEIEATTQLLVFGRLTVGNDPGNRNYERVTTIDPSFFEVFNFRLLEGTPDNVFSQPKGILLTRTLKERYFGSLPALNKTLKTNLFEGVVAGVMEDFPANTHLYAEFMVPTQTVAASVPWWNEFMATNWNRNSVLTYMKLRPDTKVESLGQRITQLTRENWPDGQPFNTQFRLQPVQDIHLYAGEVEGEINQTPGNAFYVSTFFWFGLVILLVACFNYTGLLNVAFQGRSREIGVRKAVGAGRGSLAVQFFAESLLLTVTAILLALGLLQWLKPLIAGWLGTAFDWSLLPADQILLSGVAGLAICLLSIVYPVLLSARRNPVSALKDEGKGRSKMPLRKVMTVFQFAVAVALIACTLIFYRQVQFLQSKDRGFDLEGLVVVDINSGALRSKFEAIKQAFSGLPEVQSVSVSSRVPGEWKPFPIVSVHPQGQAATSAEEMIFIGADQDFLNTYRIELQDGLNFSGALSDSSKILINHSAAKALGLSQPVGQWVEIPAVNWSGDNNPFDRPLKVQIAGVVADFQFEDFRHELKPMVIGFWRNPVHNIDYYTLRIASGDWAATLASLRRINDRFDSENPLEYTFLNEQFQRFIEADLRRSRLLMFFSGVVVLIACLGLFAMVAFVLQRRTREIGIRRILGAGVSGIVGLVSADFLRLVVLGSLFAIPAAWLLMQRWLEEFAFRTPLHWWMFAAAGLVALFIAGLTTGFQSVKAALANPALSLKSE